MILLFKIELIQNLVVYGNKITLKFALINSRFFGINNVKFNINHKIRCTIGW